MSLQRNESTNGVVLMVKLAGSLKFCVAAIIASGLSTAANAAPITYDFTGQGAMCGASCFEGEFFGTITMDLIAPGPAGDDSTVYEDIGYAADPSGWVNSSFSINWEGGSFAPAAFDGAVTAEQSAVVVNGPDNDWFEAGVFYEDDDAGFDRSEGATFTRYTEDTSWLNSLSFPLQLGLANGPGSFNELNFHSYFYNFSTQESASSRGTVQVQSLVARQPTGVPEPSTIYLLAMGLAALLFRRAKTA
jgi:hypothetical protein